MVPGAGPGRDVMMWHRVEGSGQGIFGKMKRGQNPVSEGAAARIAVRSSAVVQSWSQAMLSA